MRYKQIQGWFNQQGEDLYKEMLNAFNDGSHFVEIGCFLGRSTCCMAELIKEYQRDITFDVIDTFEGSPEHQEFLKGKNLYDLFISNMKSMNVLDSISSIIRNKSVDAAKAYRNKSIDFAFIDANHSYPFVKEDIQTWLPKIKNRGILAGDDYTPAHKGVIRAVDELLGKDIRKSGHYWVYWNVK